MWLFVLALACTGAGAPGGDDTGTATDPLVPPGELVASSAERELEPSTEDLPQLVADNQDFAFALLGELAEGSQDNLFLSPHSISVALAMGYAGAEGETEAQMAEALRFTLPEDRLHPAFNALDLLLADVDSTSSDGAKVQLTVLQQLFGQAGAPFEAPYLDTLAMHYGAGMRLLDFAAQPDLSREAINLWVAAMTEARIEELLPPESIRPETRLVLVNTIDLVASWQVPFQVAATRAEDFTLLGGETVTVDMMRGEQRTSCAVGDGYTIARLSFTGGELELVLVVPELDRFDEIQAALVAGDLDEDLRSMGTCDLILGLPRFAYRSAFELSEHLESLGMVDAFDDQLADFSGASPEPLYVGSIQHQAVVAVDEAGITASASTALIDHGTSAPDEVRLTVDRPFFFLVRPHARHEVLFLGRVLDPTG